MGMDDVFRALADPTRRHLLDRLREDDGLTLGQLCEQLGMRRQSVSQHLGVLEAANLVATVRRGREKLHYLNPVPLHEVQERWVGAFERPRLAALSTLRRRAEATMDKPDYVYVTYIAATPERVWEALTDADATAAYWGHANVSTWEQGASWEHRRTDGSDAADVVGTVVVSEPPHRLVTTWDDPATVGGAGAPPPSRVTFTIEPWGDIVRLTVVHEDLPDEDALRDVASGWPAVLSNLKSYLETGATLPAAPWEMPVRPPQGTR